jgi:hypothetical protein
MTLVVLKNLARAQNREGVEASKKGDYTTALAYYQQALANDPAGDPGNEIIRDNLAAAEEQIAAARREQEQRRQDTIAAGKMQQAIRDIAQSLNAVPSAGGSAFNGKEPGHPSDQAGGLTFMAPNSATGAFGTTSNPSNPALELSAGAPPVAVHGATDQLKSVRIIKGINAFARQLGWSATKQARLANALKKLKFDGDPNSTGLQINRTWRDIIVRGQDAALVREASQGGGLGFPGAGTQTVNNDCTIFALANASGLPYGAVGARATELIRQGEWRSVDERAAPQAVIEKHGLIGGEVVMLAEVFGQAEVVPSTKFAKTVREGRPVMVNLVPENGDVRLGHQVVLTKTFKHGGETWYVMMDSNQGPQRFLFLSARELHTMLQEHGVAYRPNPGTTPTLLRNGGAQ